jgi:DNA modification methylase
VILTGDCRDRLREMPAESVHCVVTSPPYWGLRDYRTPPQVWDGDTNCDHQWGPVQRGKRQDIKPIDETTSTARLGTDERQSQAALDGGRFCHRCGAWLGHLGLEPTPDLYVAHIVAIFRELRRVLRDDGTLWLNIGDSYASKARGSDEGWDKSRLTNPGTVQKAQPHRCVEPASATGVRAAD